MKFIPWVCRIFGHKWKLKSSNEYYDKNERKHRDILWMEITHCDRCGEPNPRMIK